MMGGWWTGARPHTLPAAAAPVVVGGGLAAGQDAFAALPFLAALAGALAIQVGTNFANDYFDGLRGADVHRRGGFARLTQGGLVPAARVRRWMLGAFAAACVPGLYLVWVGGWPIAVLGLASIAAGVAYTGGPWPLGYHGLGDLFVLLFFGLGAVGGTHYVQARHFDAESLLAGLGVGAVATAILVVNNLRDIETDARAGKETLAVRLGATGSRVEYVLLLLVAALVPVTGVLGAGWGAGVLVAPLALVAAVGPLRTVLGTLDPFRLDAALAGTGRLLALYGLLLGGGLALGGAGPLP